MASGWRRNETYTFPLSIQSIHWIYMKREAGLKEEEHGFKMRGRISNNFCYADDISLRAKHAKDFKAQVIK